MNESKLLCKKLYEIKTLSLDDIRQVRMLLVDFFAAACAGAKQNKGFNDKVRKVLFIQGGKAESSILFTGEKLPARSAAFMNSLYGHGAELDDGCRMAMGHVGVHVIPAVLALAEAERKTQKEIMIAIAVGYEAHIRVSAAAQPGMVNRSFHSTGMAGGIACAAACAKLLNLNAEGMEDAMSLASTMSSGLLTYSESRQMIKPINPAKAAETGVFAAKLAQAGIKGPLNFLEGPNGWFHAVADSVDKKMITKEFGHLLIHDCYFKLYPSCRHTHCGIEAAINIHKIVRPSEIKRVNVHIYPYAIKLAGQIKCPAEPDETKFSIHYTCAIALLYGEYGVRYMNPPLSTDTVKDMIRRIELIPDDDMENREKGIRGTRIEVIMKDDSKIENTVLVPKGDPQKPFSEEDLYTKLKLCAMDIVNEGAINKLITHISEFGGNKIIDVKAFMKFSDNCNIDSIMST